MINNNLFSKILKFSGILIISLLMMNLLVQCNKDDMPDTDSPIIVRGTDIINCPDCTPQDYLEGLMAATDNGGIFGAYGLVPSQQWFLDVPHSAINWSSAFNGFGADLTGKFTYFSLTDMSFDETNPANISFEANVLLNSVVTGQPLRDEGCLLTTYGTAADKAFEAENLAILKTNSAKFNIDDDGYTIDAELTFLGTTHPVTITLYYLGQSTFTGYKIASFEAELTFNAISDFGLNSTSVNDLITVNMSINLRNTD